MCRCSNDVVAHQPRENNVSCTRGIVFLRSSLLIFQVRVIELQQNRPARFYGVYSVFEKKKKKKKKER